MSGAVSGAGGWLLVNSRQAAFDAEKELSHLRPLLTARERRRGAACAESVNLSFQTLKHDGRDRRSEIIRSRKELSAADGSRHVGRFGV